MPFSDIVLCCYTDRLIHFVAHLRKQFYYTGKKVYEPAHDKTYKMAYAPSKDSDQPRHPPSLISLRCPYEESLGP